jgi:hypothetical protein
MQSSNSSTTSSSRKITKAIAFSYIDAEKEIPRALDPWYPHVDKIIAIDGLYKTPLSPAMKRKNLPHYSQDNSDHILKTRYPDKIISEKLYGTQMEKRQKCFDIAAEEDIDIVIVWDSDEYIHPEYQDWNMFHKQIAHCLQHHPNEIILRMYCYIPDEQTWGRQHNDYNGRENFWRTYDRIHIAPGTQRYALSHYTWAPADTPDEKIQKWLFDLSNKWSVFPECPYFLWPKGIICDGIRIGMDRKLRTAAQLEHGNDWAWQEIHDEVFRYIMQPFWHSKGQKLIGDLGEYYYDDQGIQRLHNAADAEKAGIVVHDPNAAVRNVPLAQ